MALKDKALKTADPAALIIGGLVAIAGALGLWSKLHLSVDAVQALQGGLLAVAAGARMALGRGGS